MIKRLKIIAISVVVAGAIGAIGFSFNSMRVHAATPESNKLQLVAAHCDIIQTRLKIAQKTELAARIKRGRAYDQEILAFVAAFNSRVTDSNIDAPRLFEVADELQEAAGPTQFGQLYTVYADDIDSAINSDCESNPAITYGWIEKARVDRAALADQVQEIDQLIGEYIAELEKLEERLSPVINKPEDTPQP